MFCYIFLKIVFIDLPMLYLLGLFVQVRSSLSFRPSRRSELAVCLSVATWWCIQRTKPWVSLVKCSFMTYEMRGRWVSFSYSVVVVDFCCLFSHANMKCRLEQYQASNPIGPWPSTQWCRLLAIVVPFTNVDALWSSVLIAYSCYLVSQLLAQSVGSCQLNSFFCGMFWLS